MTTVVLVDGGEVTPGENRFTSFSETPQSGEVGQIIRFPGRPTSDVRFYGIKKVVYPYVGGGAVEDFPFGVTAYKIWNPTVFFPVSTYEIGGSTVIYFPEKSSLPLGSEFLLFRVFP